MKKLISTILIICMIIPFGASSAYANENLFSYKYAYSIGVNHGLFGSLTGNFTNNVQYAADAYGTISDITHSYYNFTPDVTYMFGNNPNGDRRIASNIVFLNGHGDSYHIAFNAGNNGGTYATGVVNDTDDTSARPSGYQYVGLMSTDMSSCDHISFVNCESAKTDNVGNCLSRRAYWEGANSSLGFTDEIHSRFYHGPDWLEVYNDSLASGSTINQCVATATAAYPNSDLGDYAKVWGSSYNTVASVGNVLNSASHLPNNLYNVISIDPIHVNRNTLHNVEYEPLQDYFTSLETLINEIQKIDDSFSTKDYKIMINMFGADTDVGMIKIVYCIGDMIRTNKAYTALVEQGTITTLYQTICGTKESYSAETLIRLVETHTHNLAVDTLDTDELKSFSDPIIKVTQEFFYDYSDNSLVAVDSVFFVASLLDDAIVDHTIVTVLGN